MIIIGIIVLKIAQGILHKDRKYNVKDIIGAHECVLGYF